MARTWHSLIGLLPLVYRSRGTPQASTRPPTECRHIVSQIAHSADESAWHMAMVSIYDCPDELGPTLSELWRILPSDSMRLHLLYGVSGHVHDAVLYRQIVSRALDSQAPDSLRFAAIGTLVTIIDSSRFMSVQRVAGVLFSDTGVTVSLGHSSHPFIRYGRNPLPRGVRDSVLALLQDLSTRDPSALVRRVARRAREALTYVPRPR